MGSQIGNDQQHEIPLVDDGLFSVVQMFKSQKFANLKKTLKNLALSRLPLCNRHH